MKIIKQKWKCKSCKKCYNKRPSICKCGFLLTEPFEEITITDNGTSIVQYI